MNDIETEDGSVAPKDEIDAIALMKKFSPKTYDSALAKDKGNLDESSYDYLLSELAESALSSEITGKPGADINLITIDMESSFEKDVLIEKLMQAEFHYLESLESVRKFRDIKKFEDMQDASDIIRSIKLGISRFNIIFVIVLICGLAWSAINLPGDALALVSAVIGGAITHLLSERQAVLSLKKETKESEGGCPRNSGD